MDEDGDGEEWMRNLSMVGARKERGDGGMCEVFEGLSLLTVTWVELNFLVGGANERLIRPKRTVSP